MDKYYLGLSVHPAQPSLMGAQEEIALRLRLTKTQAQTRFGTAQEPCRSTLQTLAHNLGGKPEGPGEAEPA